MITEHAIIDLHYSALTVTTLLGFRLSTTCWNLAAGIICHSASRALVGYVGKAVWLVVSVDKVMVSKSVLHKIVVQTQFTM